VPDYNHRTRIPAWAIRDLVDRIAARFKPQKIILFGSYARGDFTRDSDVDLLIVMETRGRHRPSLAIRRQVPIEFGVDLIVLSEAQLRRRLKAGDFFLQEAIEQGKTMYEAGDEAVDR
jgi:predicted nucleotidyltransferase